MHSIWLSRYFLIFSKIHQIKEGGRNFFGGTNSAEWLNSLVPTTLFQIWKFERAKFFVIHWISVHSTWFTSSLWRFWNFLKLRTEDLISLGEAILQNGWIISFPLLYFNFRSLKDPNSLLFIRFQCILHHSVVLFSGFWNFLKLKTGDLISWGEPILQNSWIIKSPLVYFNFRNLRDPNSWSFTRFQCTLPD